MSAPRDTQRSKVYAAENVVYPKSPEGLTVAEVQEFVTKVVRSSWWADRYPTGLVAVNDGRGRRSACAIGRVEISIPRWARSRHVVLHELAHIAMTRLHGSRVADHGWEFCSAELALVRRFIGVAAHDALRDSFRAHGVRYTAPRAVPVAAKANPERDARLAAWREANATKKSANDRIASLLDPVAVEQATRANFTGVYGIRIEITDSVAGLIRQGKTTRAERDDGVWWTPGDGFNAQEARTLGAQWGRAYALARPGHTITVALIGDYRRGGQTKGLQCPEIATYRAGGPDV